MYSNLLNESELQASLINLDLANLVLEFGAGGQHFAIRAKDVERVIGYHHSRRSNTEHDWADFHYTTNVGALPVMTFNRLAGIQTAVTDRRPSIVILSGHHNETVPRCGLLVHDLRPDVQAAEEILVGDVPPHLNGSSHLFSATAVLAGRQLPLLRHPLHLA